MFRFIFALALSLVAIVINQPPAFAVEISAGTARVDLTPPLNMNAPLGGYGERMNRPAEGVHDRVFAKALVLSDGQKRFVLVTCDLLGLAPPVKPEILKRLGDDWTAEQVLILPSHSHASIEMNAINPSNTFGIPQIGIHDPELYDFTVNHFVDVIRRAADDLQPVTVGTSSHHIPGWNRNRRADGMLVDDEITITRVDRIGGKPLAVLVNFTAHPTMMSAKEMMFSAGWPGALQRTLEATIGQGVMAMYYNGAQGDQTTIGRPSGGNSNWERSTQYGLELGLLAARKWESIDTRRNVAFDFHLQSIDLPETCWHPDFMSTGGAEYGLTEEILTELLPKMQPTQTTSGTLRLGELLIIGIPGEMSAELGINLKEKAKEITGASHPVVGGLANEWISYILTAQAYRTGRYEASVSFYGETLGDTITNGAITGIQDMPNR